VGCLLETLCCVCRAGDVFIRLAFTFVGALGLIAAAAGGQVIYIYIYSMGHKRDISV
jgi:hypothetical protein